MMFKHFSLFKKDLNQGVFLQGMQISVFCNCPERHNVSAEHNKNKTKQNLAFLAQYGLCSWLEVGQDRNVNCFMEIL